MIIRASRAAALLATIAFCSSNGTSGSKDVKDVAAGTDAAATAASKVATISNPQWSFAIQAWTFHEYSFLQALSKAESCSFKNIEAMPGQTLGHGIEGKMSVDMPAAKRQQVLDSLKAHGITLVAFGVVVPQTENEWKQTFEFAKAMGLKYIVAEPKDEHWDLVSKLCDQYQIPVAIHDHPRPAHYWHPDSVLLAIKGRSPLFGACADLGHWVRNGLDPVECLKKLEGHIIGVHLKDPVEKGNSDSRDTILGRGAVPIPAALTELQRQGFKGNVSLEYEANFSNNVADVKQCVEYYHSLIK